jgi:hypothetical protein
LIIHDDADVRNMLRDYFSEILPEKHLIFTETQAEGRALLDQMQPCLIVLQSKEMYDEDDRLDSTARKLMNDELTKHIKLLVLVRRRIKPDSTGFIDQSFGYRPDWIIGYGNQWR